MGNQQIDKGYAGKAKGIAQILWERGLHRKTVTWKLVSSPTPGGKTRNNLVHQRIQSLPGHTPRPINSLRTTAQNVARRRRTGPPPEKTIHH